ncbi:PEGA domain-containing protein [Candidatus Saccharibacteria bacterium]|nr:PEGA domain-containing protein [Candidatus Saccharibacteria bacterium]
MDREKKRRRQSFKVIVSEILMTLAVVVTVIVLAFIVSGYWVNSDFEVERQGLLQVSSVPTGAEVVIDDESAWLQRTNTSKVLPSGTHKVELKKEGYDSWSKTIDISEGLLYRLHYPRLFLLKREKEKILSVGGATFASVSPNRKTLLVANNTTEWKLIDLDRESIEAKKINIAEYFSGVSMAEGATVGLFNSDILDADWAKDDNHILFKVRSGENVEWVLVDVRNLKNTINLTKEFGVNFSKVEILDNSANNLLIVQNSNLQRVDLSSKAISAVIVENIVSFDHFENEVIYVAKKDEGFVMGKTEIGDNEPEILDHLASSARVLISKFYDDKYITLVQGQTVTLYREDDYIKVQEYELSFVPESLKVGHNGEFIIMASGGSIATLDMEAMKTTEWSLGDAKYGWVDNDMIYTVKEGELSVYDFDGLNHRSLAKNVSEHFPATITSDKWLYYFSDDYLVREWLIKR